MMVQVRVGSGDGMRLAHEGIEEGLDGAAEGRVLGWADGQREVDFLRSGSAVDTAVIVLGNPAAPG